MVLTTETDMLTDPIDFGALLLGAGVALAALCILMLAIFLAVMAVVEATSEATL